MTWMKQSLALGLAGLTAGAIVSQASAATISIETHKDNVVNHHEPDVANRTTNQTLDVWNRGLSYLAFDLNVLPQNAVITEAVFGVYDPRLDASQAVRVELIDVDADWIETGEGALTWNIAAANYGARLDGNNAIVDPEVMLWRGELKLDAEGEPSERFARTDPWGEPSVTDQDLLDGLNNDLANGDGLVVFTLRGTSGTNNYVPSRENETYPPATLHLTYEIIPEPASLALLGLGGGLIALRRRPA